MGYWKEQSYGSNRSRAFSPKWEGPFEITFRPDSALERLSMSRSEEAVTAFNARVQEWGAKVKAALGPSISRFDIKGNRLNKSLRNNYYFDFGEIYRIGFSFAREGIFVHKGVGRGYVMRGGTVVKTSKTIGFNRKPKPWFNPVIEEYISELEDIVHEHIQGAIVNTVRIYIR